MRNLRLWRAVNAARLSSRAQSDKLTYLRNVANGAEIFLLGTVHVSKRSAIQVKQLIRIVKPNLVAVELCPGRASSLLDEAESMEEEEAHTKQGFFREFMDCPGRVGEKSLHVVLKYFYQIVHDAGLEPAKEFKVAADEARKLGADLYLIDQDMEITRQRVSRTLTLPIAIRLIWTLIRMKDSDVLFNAIITNKRDAVEKLNSRKLARNVIGDLQQKFPEVVKALLSERDELMTERLLSCEGTVVAVVGLAHMDGIEQKWNTYQKKSV